MVRYTLETKGWIDKPNCHRLLELCSHTISQIRYGRNICQLVLEMVHRSFKNWVEKNSIPSSPLNAVDWYMGRQWLWRIQNCFYPWKDGSKSEKNERSVDWPDCLLARKLLFATLDPRKWNVSCLLEVPKWMIYSLRISSQCFEVASPRQNLGNHLGRNSVFRYLFLRAVWMRMKTSVSGRCVVWRIPWSSDMGQSVNNCLRNLFPQSDVVRNIRDIVMIQWNEVLQFRQWCNPQHLGMMDVSVSEFTAVVQTRYLR